MDDRTNVAKMRDYSTIGDDAIRGVGARSAFYQFFIEFIRDLKIPLADSHLDLGLDISMKIGASGHQEVMATGQIDILLGLLAGVLGVINLKAL